VSQNGQLLSRRGRSLPANAGGVDTHRDSISSRFDCRSHNRRAFWAGALLCTVVALALAAVVVAWLAQGTAWAAVLLTMCASSAITVAILAQTALPGFPQPTTLRSWLLGSDFLAGAGPSSGSAADIPEYATRPSVTWELRGLQGHPERGTVRRPWRSFCAAVLAGISLCKVCSCYEILRAPRPRPGGREAADAAQDVTPGAARGAGGRAAPR
jgi:hypothetical protein